ncbi:selenocysteine-specific translation elongation factor [Nonomuraea roseoviolacea]|uniref:Selenocysteine-specific elongation factor n=1 Tax=Nonomuraea roseoviolacea subsp. carminata TaxID=160689 RepID=A0ABT1KB51_9ACTN|nr:selenocysteine-specific translation elongation factor [Nonomuraea roseoviolacea]MCP2351241.1 selenocysteine-specific elongation factor [Nonomuraea roseoviolacea subsp. carminata]
MTHVVATAGHVDHGKSTLVRALTGMEPDRLAEERRRGLTIELGYAWTVLPSGERLAFVDVPGHERFLATMLAGVGPVPAVMFVVAADEGWMPQSEEHLVALEALGVRHGVLVVTRADLADPRPAAERARDRLREAGLGGAETVVVSGRTGQGLDGLRAALDRLVAALPPPDPSAPVRLWVDRAFSVTGSGTVVTGTLPAGTVAVGDELLLAGEPVRVRALESLKEPRETVSAVARVAVNLRGHAVPERGQALVTPGRWTYTELVDVLVSPVGGHPRDEGECGRLPGRLTVHVGSAAVTCEVRPLGGAFARLRPARPLPLHLGDVLLLRDPGRDPGRDRAGVRVLAGATVLDVRPEPLRRRGAAQRRATLLDTALLETGLLETGLLENGLPAETAFLETGLRETAFPEGPGAAFALRLHGLLRAADLRAMGVEPSPRTAATEPAGPVCGDWYAEPRLWAEQGRRLADVVRRHALDNPLEPGMPVEAARHELGLPDRRLVVALVRPPLTLAAGRICAGPAGLPPPVAGAVERLRRELAARPFHAPEAARLAELGLGARELAAAVRAGALLRVGEGVVLLPGADERAAEVLGRLPQPFTVSQARQALGTSRRVAVPLLEHLDRAGLTERLDDVRRRLVERGRPPYANPPT